MLKNTQYDVLVFIGRFSPLHLGHESVIKQAIRQAKQVIILVGSSHAPRDIRNPWTFKERKRMILGVVPSHLYESHRLSVLPITDYPYNDNKWKASVRGAVNSALSWTDYPPKIGLIGHSKDASSYYLKMFPDWGSVEVDNYENINATDIREGMFEKTLQEKRYEVMSRSVLSTLDSDEGFSFSTPNMWELSIDALQSEWNLIKQYKEAWKAAPYSPTFHTTDAVVIQSGHVLLVKRKASPGIGQWALPGGFLNQDETLLSGAIRELKEETKIDVPVRTLRRLAEGTEKVFDDPFRSTRGRTITTAFFIDLGDDEKLPKISAADDAEKVKWVSFDNVNRQLMFEDHFHIIDWFTNIG